MSGTNDNITYVPAPYLRGVTVPYRANSIVSIASNTNNGNINVIVSAPPRNLHLVTRRLNFDEESG